MPKKAVRKKGKKKTPIEYCADAIAIRGGDYVFIERLTEPKGLALIGGRLAKGEDVKQCIIREVREEIGCEFTVHRMLGFFDAPGRDPRGPKVTTVFVGSALGRFRNEEGKTKVIVLSAEKAKQRKNEFVFDHYEIFDYFLRGGGMKTEEGRSNENV